MIPGMFSRQFPQQPYAYQYGHPLRCPFPSSPLSVVGVLITLSGLLALCSVCAPDLLEMKLPGWRERFGVIITIGVALGLFRSVWRTIIPLLSVGFWLIALACLWKPDMKEFLQRVALTSPQQVTSGLSEGRSPTIVPASLPSTSFTSVRRLPSALPEAAYFGRSSGGLSSALTSSIPQAKRSIGQWLGR